MSERNFARFRNRTAADQTGLRNRMMWIFKRTLGDQTRFSGQSGDRMNFRDFERFFKFERRQNRRQTFRQHRFSSDVFKYIRRQVEEVVYATLTVDDGTFFFLDGVEESRLASAQVVSANALLMDGVTRMDEMKYFREKVPNSQYVPEAVPAVRPPVEELAQVFNAVDGRRSVEEIGRVTELGEFETTKSVYTLMQSKHVHLRPPRLSGGATAIVAAANDVLRAVFKAVAAADRSEELRESLASFAVGAGVYDMLFRGAGPDDAGCLDAAVVADNAMIVAAAADPEAILKQMLHDYVSFALFSGGAILGKDAETRLTQQVAQPLTNLRPGA
jgi:hypothetical protein